MQAPGAGREPAEKTNGVPGLLCNRGLQRTAREQKTTGRQPGAGLKGDVPEQAIVLKILINVRNLRMQGELKVISECEDTALFLA